MKRNSVAHKVAKFIRCCVYFFASCIIFHGIIVLYGAPLIESVLETFLFAVLLSTFTTLHCLCLLGPNFQVWLRVFSKNGNKMPKLATPGICILASLIVASVTELMTGCHKLIVGTNCCEEIVRANGARKKHFERLFHHCSVIIG
uniref:Uncharacterized protein n=1 Tax=Sphaerodactylus townsendi TaxID=933632 RepID=A0ACB8GA68_9SAUR